MEKAMNGGSGDETFVEMMDDSVAPYKISDIPERDKGRLVWLRANGNRE